MGLQGVIRFPGVLNHGRWSYTLSHGITPGCCSVDIAPQAEVPAETGTLQILFGSVRMQFPDAICDAARSRRNTNGQVITLAILDRRWKWRFGEIYGHYNIRRQNGRVDTATEQSPQELATLLLQAMGEAGFSVAELPNLARPEVDWVAANPASELASLAESLGCRVVLGLDNRVSLRRIGQGRDLPLNGVQQSIGYGIDPPMRPDTLKLVGGRTRYQTKFLCKAVALDGDDSIVRLDDVDYKPTDGWGYEAFFGFGNISDAADRARANKSAFRWYKIVGTAAEGEGKFRIPGLPKSITVNDLRQLLPIERTRVETFEAADESEQMKDALVEGIFWDRALDGDNVPSIRRYEGQVTIDAERGIVQFGLPVLKRTASETFEEAEIYLTIGHSVQTSDSRLFTRYERERSLPGEKLDTGPQIIRRDDVVATIIGKYNDKKLTDTTTNQKDLDREADYHLDAAELEFQTLETGDIEYAGIVPIQPDGAIQQVGFSGGTSGAQTRASRNSEFSNVVLPWKERRMIEQQRNMLR